MLPVQIMIFLFPRKACIYLSPCTLISFESSCENSAHSHSPRGCIAAGKGHAMKGRAYHPLRGDRQANTSPTIDFSAWLQEQLRARCTSAMQICLQKVWLSARCGLDRTSFKRSSKIWWWRTRVFFFLFFIRNLHPTMCFSELKVINRSRTYQCLRTKKTNSNMKRETEG